MNDHFRETTVRVFGVERVIRTERKTCVKELETSHTKAVKAALEELHSSAVPAYADRIRALGREDVITEVGRTHDYHTAQKLVSRHGGASGTRALAELLITEFGKRRFTAGSSEYPSMRRPFPKVRYTDAPDGLAKGLTETAPGQFTDALDDAPKSDWLSFWQ